MGQWIQETLSAGHLGPAVLPAVFLLGVLGAVSSCCTLPVIGAVAGYSGTMGDRPGRREVLLVGLCFMVGTVVSLAAIGAVTGFVGQVAGASLGKYWRLGGGIVMVCFGLVGLGLLPLNIPAVASGSVVLRRGAIGAVVYGLAVGGIATGCSVGCNPLLAMAIGASVVKGATVAGALMLGVFAIGYSLPLAAAIVGMGFGLGRLGGVARRATPVLRAGASLVLIGVGFYLLATG